MQYFFYVGNAKKKFKNKKSKIKSSNDTFKLANSENFSATSLTY